MIVEPENLLENEPTLYGLNRFFVLEQKTIEVLKPRHCSALWILKASGDVEAQASGGFEAQALVDFEAQAPVDFEAQAPVDFDAQASEDFEAQASKNCEAQASKKRKVDKF